MTENCIAPKGILIMAYKSGCLMCSAIDSNNRLLDNIFLTEKVNNSDGVVSVVLVNDIDNTDLFARTDKGKAILFNCSLLVDEDGNCAESINLFRGGRSGNLIFIKAFEDSDINNKEYYRVNTLPALGYYIKGQ